MTHSAYIAAIVLLVVWSASAVAIILFGTLHQRAKLADREREQDRWFIHNGFNGDIVDQHHVR